MSNTCPNIAQMLDFGREKANVLKVATNVMNQGIETGGGKLYDNSSQLTPSNMVASGKSNNSLSNNSVFTQPPPSDKTSFSKT